MLSLSAPRATKRSGKISIHVCMPSDADGVAHLVGLGELPAEQAFSADLLVGVVDHRVVAVLTADGDVVSDPFVPAAQACELLKLRGRQLGRSLHRATGAATPFRLLRTWYQRGYLWGAAATEDCLPGSVAPRAAQSSRDHT